MKIEYKVLQTKDNIERAQNVRILKHFIPSLEVTISDRENLWDNYIKQFTITDDVDGIVLLDDDIKLCKDFQKRCEDEIKNHPEDVISFFRICRNTTVIDKAEYRSGSTFSSFCCNYFPKWLCKEFVNPQNQKEFRDYYFGKGEVWICPNDTYVSFLLKKLKRKYWSAFPHLIQHECYKSTLGNRSTKRQTTYFIDEMRVGK